MTSGSIQDIFSDLELVRAGTGMKSDHQMRWQLINTERERERERARGEMAKYHVHQPFDIIKNAHIQIKHFILKNQNLIWQQRCCHRWVYSLKVNLIFIFLRISIFR